MKIKLLFLLALFALAAGPKPAYAVTLGEALKTAYGDVVQNSKLTFLEQSETGWGWNLKDDSNGAPMAMLGIYQYRFVNLNGGWADPVNEDLPVILAGIHLDQLGRTLMPNSADFIQSIVPASFRPVWSKLTISYGPGYDLEKQPKDALTHFVAVNFLFGGDK